MSSQTVKSEDACCQKYDRFVANAITNAGVGLGVGALFSLVLFRRRAWPIHYGIGIGLGYALKDFEFALNNVVPQKAGGSCPSKK